MRLPDPKRLQILKFCLPFYAQINEIPASFLVKSPVCRFQFLHPFFLLKKKKCNTSIEMLDLVDKKGTSAAKVV